MATDHQNVDPDRPVVLDTGASGAPPGWQPRRTVFAVAVTGILAAGGLAAGSWSIWSAVSGTEPTETHAPLWFSPPAPVAPAESPAATSTAPTTTAPAGQERRPRPATGPNRTADSPHANEGAEPEGGGKGGSNRGPGRGGEATDRPTGPH